MKAKNSLKVTYWIYRYNKPFKVFPTKAELLKFFDRLPKAQRKGLKIKTSIKFSLAR